MQRLFWFGLGVAVTAVVMVKGRQLIRQATPGGLIDQAAQKASGWWERANEFITDFNQDRRMAEAELRRQQGLPVAETTTAATAATATSSFVTEGSHTDGGRALWATPR